MSIEFEQVYNPVKVQSFQEKIESLCKTDRLRMRIINMISAKQFNNWNNFYCNQKLLLGNEAQRNSLELFEPYLRGYNNRELIYEINIKDDSRFVLSITALDTGKELSRYRCKYRKDFKFVNLKFLKLYVVLQDLKGNNQLYPVLTQKMASYKQWRQK